MALNRRNGSLAGCLLGCSCIGENLTIPFDYWQVTKLLYMKELTAYFQIRVIPLLSRQGEKYF